MVMDIKDVFKLRSIDPRKGFYYDVHFTVVCPPGKSPEPDVDGSLRVKTRFAHGRRSNHPRIEEIEEQATKNVRRVFLAFR